MPRTGRGQVVVTTANRRLDAEADVVEVEAFDEASAASYLLERTSRTDSAAAGRVAQRVGGLPVALELAADHATATGASFDAYLHALDDPSAPAGLRINPPDSVVESSVLVALRAVSGLSPAALPALAALCLGTADAPLPHRLANAVGVEGEPPLVDVLSSYGLAVADGRSMAVPSAVRQAAGHLLADLPAEQAGQEASARLVGALDEATAGAAGEDLDELAPHAVAAATTLAPARPTAAGARLAACATRWTAAQGATQEAVVVAEHGVDAARTRAGHPRPGHPCRPPPARRAVPRRRRHDPGAGDRGVRPRRLRGRAGGGRRPIGRGLRGAGPQLPRRR